MANGHKLTFSLSERYLGSYNNDYHSNGNGTASSDASELVEEDVWSTVNDDNGRGDAREDRTGSRDSYQEWSSSEGSSIARHRRVQHGSGRGGGDRRRERNVSGLSLAFEDLHIAAAARIMHQFRGNEGAASRRSRKTACSAPVNVPDWSKIYRVDAVESMHNLDEEEREAEMVPPHEYLARSRKIAAESVFEGVGRTLKGRDMRRVRDAVWSQTGFYG